MKTRSWARRRCASSCLNTAFESHFWQRQWQSVVRTPGLDSRAQLHCHICSSLACVFGHHICSSLLYLFISSLVFGVAVFAGVFSDAMILAPLRTRRPTCGCPSGATCLAPSWSLRLRCCPWPSPTPWAPPLWALPSPTPSRCVSAGVVGVSARVALPAFEETQPPLIAMLTINMVCQALRQNGRG